MTGQMCPCSATRSAPQIAGYATLEQLLVILDQYERTMTAMTGLEPGIGVINDLMVVQHDCLSTPAGEALGSRQGAMADLSRCDDLVEQR
jgi:hypothetical protein